MNKKLFTFIAILCFLEVALTQNNPCGICQYSSNGYNQPSPCVNCPPGQCTIGPGTTGSSPSACTIKACVQGYYSSTGFDTDGSGTGCKACNAGTSTPNTQTRGTTQSVCTVTFKACAQGSYSASGFDTDGAGTGCKACNAGTSTPNTQTVGTDQSICTITFKACPAGSYSASGFDTDGNGAGCTQCTANTYSAQSATSCSPCTNNRTSPVGSTAVTACVCPSGTTGPTDGISKCSNNSSSGQTSGQKITLFVSLIFILMSLF